MGAVLASGDFTSDGKPDLVSVARYTEADPVSVLIGRGDGTFQKTTSSAGGGLSLAAGDLNGDGKLDVAFPGFSSVVKILFGNGDGTFGPPVGIGTHSGGAPGGIMSIAIAQLGGAEPGLDIAVTNSNGLQVLLGNGNGTFAAPATYSGWDASELVAGDFNEDGRDDIGLTRFVGPDTRRIVVLPGSATGALGSAITTTIDEGLSSPVVTDDDDDGLLDIVGAHRSMSSTTVALHYGAGDGTFESPQSADVGGQASSVGVGDFDSDARPDIAAARFDGRLVAWLGTGFFADSAYSQVPGDAAASMAVADVNGDGVDDVSTATYSGKVIVSRNAPGIQAAPGTLAFASQAIGGAAPTQTITVTNTGTPNLIISGLTVEGAAATDFTAGGGCQGAAVPAGATCSIVAGFTPGATGARTATLVISGNQAGGPTRLPLVGTGIAPPSSGIAPDRSPPRITLKVRRERLATILRRGLKLSIRCSETCNVNLSAAIDPRIARRLHLSRSRKPFVVARSQLSIPAGQSRTRRLRFSRRAARALSKERSITLTLTARARDSARNTASKQQKVRLRR